MSRFVSGFHVTGPIEDSGVFRLLPEDSAAASCCWKEKEETLRLMVCAGQIAAAPLRQRAALGRLAAGSGASCTALGVAAIASEADALSAAWARTHAIRAPAVATSSPAAPPAAPPAPRRAWVTLLTKARSLSEVGYARGVVALHNSLLEVDTEYPFVVMVTAGVADEVRADLAARQQQPCLARRLPLRQPQLQRRAVPSPRRQVRLADRVARQRAREERDIVPWRVDDLLAFRSHLLSAAATAELGLERLESVVHLALERLELLH